MKLENHYYECLCGSDEHTLRFTFDPDDQDGELVFSTFLHHYEPWYKRIWIAVKYVFGYKCKYGHFDTTLLGVDEVYRLHALTARVMDSRKTVDSNGG